MGDRPKVDKVLLQSDGVRLEAKDRHTTALAGHYTDFVSMFHAVEDKKGPLFVLETDERHVVGYAFAFSAGLPSERESKFLDFLVHPNYYEREAGFVAEVLRRTKACIVRLLVPARDECRIASAMKAGMKLEHKFESYCTIDGMPSDLHILLRK